MSNSLHGQTIAFIGLGLMGTPMARHCHSAGATLIVHNRSRAIVDELSAEGIAPANTPAEAAAAAADGIICLCLTNSQAVQGVMSGPDGLIQNVAPGALVIDLGTTSASLTRKLDARLRTRDASLLDAPVSGGEVGAVAANLTIMAGGSDADFARALPLLRVLGEKITHMGPTGSGQVTKMANQIIVALTIGAVAEAFALAREGGVDPARVREALRGGFADSRILELHGQRMVTGDHTPGGRAAGQLKDVREALALAADLELNLPSLQNALPLWERLVEEQGHAELDHSALYKLYEGETTNGHQ